MRKNFFRIILCGVLAAALCFAAVGCSIFEHNYEKDYSQVIATISPVSETRKVDTTGDGELNTEKTFTSEEKHIYKNQLISVFNSNASSVISSGAATDAESAAEYLLNQLIYRELLLTEHDKLEFFGDIEWTQTDRNTVAQSVYSSLDSIVSDLIDDILGAHDEPIAGDPETEEKSTTYPIAPGEDAEDPDPDAVEKWSPDFESLLAVSGDFDRLSLEREAARRLVDTLEQYADSNIIASKQEKDWFERDIKRLRKLISDYREDEIYQRLFDVDYDAAKDEGGDEFDGTYIVYYMWGKSAEEQQKMTKLQKYVEDAVAVSDEEVLEYYNALVASQKIKYASSTSYSTDMTSDTTNVVYMPDDNYFYVKHILIPFSDEQSARLTEYKESGLYTKDQIKAFRERLSREIIGYPHVDGENDTSRPMRADAIFSTIKSQMSPYKYDAYQAERLFDKLVYEYNTDPGAFGSVKGYALKYELGPGETDNWAEEFAAAAREMYETLQVGQLYDKPVVTDFGVHIMYLASKTEAGVKQLKDYQTPAGYKTVESIIRDSLKTTKTSSAFSTWQQERIAYYTDTAKNIERFTKRYKDIYEG